MALNIKNEETHRLATELARLTGVSITDAVTEALKERLDRLEVNRQARYERLMWIVNDCASRMSPELKALDHGEYLYGEDGLPR